MLNCEKYQKVKLFLTIIYAFTLEKTSKSKYPSRRKTEDMNLTKEQIKEVNKISKKDIDFILSIIFRHITVVEGDDVKEIAKKVACLRAFHRWLSDSVDVNALKIKKRKADFVELMYKMVQQMEGFAGLIGLKVG